jgi:hypothetical protein
MTDWMRLLCPNGRLALTTVWILALLLGLATPSFAHQQEVPPGDGPQDADEDEDASQKLSFHAFLNQAYAISDGHQIFGIPERGTTDYRNVVLQVRYEITPRDIVVTQLSHERQGRSAIGEEREDVEFEWAFYERRLSDATTVKLGKMQLPLGLYNEIRDVGTLLPFYAPPYSVYLDNFTPENIEGAMVSHSFARDSDWSVETDFYYGGWDRIEQDAATGRVGRARAENGVGTQLWLNTPVPELRFGLGAFRFDVEEGLHQVEETDTLQVYALSADSSFGRVQLRAEGIWSELPFRLTPDVVLPNLVYVGYYGQIGVELTPKWGLTWKSDFAEIRLNSGLADLDWNEDHALGIAYRFRYNVIAKAEVHQNKGLLVEDEIVTVPVKTRYGILSWAVSF